MNDRIGFQIGEDYAHYGRKLPEGAAKSIIAGYKAGSPETGLTRAADIVVPLASWAEADGTFTSSTERVQLARRAFSPAGQALPPWKLLHGLAAGLGLELPAKPAVEALYEMLSAEYPAFEAVDFRAGGSRFELPMNQEVPNVG